MTDQRGQSRPGRPAREQSRPGRSAREQSRPGRPERLLGGVGTKVLFEDERVRVWELRLAPGEESDVHRHDFDHVLVQVGGDRVAVVPEADTEGPYRDYLEADVVPGMVVHVQRGGVETARNIGKEPYHEVIVELKDSPAGRPASAHGPRGRRTRTE